jgi:hypothetical protein
MRAIYKYASEVTIFNNFEEFYDKGAISFRDPWYVDNTSGSQSDQFNPFYSPHVPTGAVGESDPGVFLERVVRSGDPYYSIEFKSFVADNFLAASGLPLDSDDWVYIAAKTRITSDADIHAQSMSSYWSNSSGSWVRGDNHTIDVEFINSNTELYAFYKRHLASINEYAPTSINSQRKIAQEATSVSGSGQTAPRVHSVYESGDKVYYTWSKDNGLSWEGEVLVCDYDNSVCNPAIDVSDKVLDYDAIVYLVYVDETDSKIKLLRRSVSENPSSWVEVYDHGVTSAADTHPVVATLVIDGNYYAVVVWEEQGNIKYTILENDDVLIATRVYSGSGSPLPNQSFQNLTLATGSDPMLPSIGKGSMEDPVDGELNQYGIVWTEDDGALNSKLMYKGMMIEYLSGTVTVTEGSALQASNPKMPIRGNTGASICAVGVSPLIAYEYTYPKSSLRYPYPSFATSWPVMIAGRPYYQILSPHTQYTRQSSPTIYKHYTAVIAGPTGSRLINPGNLFHMKRAFVGRSLDNVGREPCIAYGSYGPGVAKPFVYVYTNGMGQTTQYPAGNSIEIGLGNNYDYVSLDHGQYHQISSNNEYYNGPCTISSEKYELTSLSENDPDKLVNAVDNKYKIRDTQTSGMPKVHVADSTLLQNIDKLRALLFWPNDSSYIEYGVCNPYLIGSDTIYTRVNWDLSHDSSGYDIWSDLDYAIRTESFDIGQNETLEFGTVLGALSPSDCGFQFRIRISLCDSTDGSVLYSDVVDMTDFAIDTTVYVLDRIDISCYAGETVYLSIAPIDTIDGGDYAFIQEIPIDADDLGKRGSRMTYTPSGILLGQNYPNPFNPTTLIPYEIVGGRYLTIDVVDSRGNVVKIVKEGYHASGQYALPFNGGHLPSGTYYFRVHDKERVIVKDMLLLR